MADESSENSRRVRWAGLIVLTLVLLLWLLHVLWSAAMEKSLRARVEQLRKSGEPMLPEDFAVANASSDRNGAPDIFAAADKFRTDERVHQDFRDEIGLPLRDIERDE